LSQVVVLLLNTGNFTETITASWADVGLKAGQSMKATDLWTGDTQHTSVAGSISAKVGSHDNAVFRLTPA
jgi:hypothetical protein